MSISIGMLGKGYSIVASDSLFTHLVTNEQKDNGKKIFMHDFGWAAESGGVRLSTRLFKDYLTRKYRFRNRKDIYTIWLLSIRDTVESVRKHTPEYLRLVERNMSNSQCVYSLNYFKDGRAHISVESIDFAYGVRKIENHNTLIVNPPKRTKRIERTIEKYTEITKKISGLYESIYLVACCIDEISRYTKFINNHVDMGISLQISDSKILLMDISKSATELKEIYRKTKTFTETMMVRKVIQC